MEVFLIIVAIVVSALFLLVDLYIMVLYSNKDEPNTSVVNIFCKVLIMLTLLQTQFQPFFLIIDVANSRTVGNDLTTFWLILYITLMANLAVLKPIATSLYERDYDDPCWKSAVWIFFEIIISVSVIGLFIGIGWTFWSIVKIPVELIEVNALNYGVSASSAKFTVLPSYLQFNSTIICFIIAFFCIFGYPVLACCGACGLTVLPITLILQFINRPTFRRTADAKKVVEFLKVQTVRLLREQQRLIREEGRLQKAQGFLYRREVNRKYEKEIRQIESQFEMHKDFYELFKLQLAYKDVNPVVYVIKLILGILSIALSIILWIQILLSQIVFPFDQGHPSVFLDNMFNFFQAQNANFVSIAFLMVICFYLTCAIIKGSVFFSNSIPFITVHPIIQRKTWLNSFLFHLTLCSMSAASLVHMLSQTFPYYLRGGSIVIFLNSLLSNMKVIGWLLSKKIFSYCFLGIGFLGVIYVSFKLVCSGESKGQLLKRIQAKRLKIFGKQNKDKTLKFIQMTDMKGEQAPLLKNDKKKQDKKEKKKDKK